MKIVCECLDLYTNLNFHCFFKKKLHHNAQLIFLITNYNLLVYHLSNFLPTNIFIQINRNIRVPYNSVIFKISVKISTSGAHKKKKIMTSDFRYLYTAANLTIGALKTVNNLLTKRKKIISKIRVWLSAS